MTQDIKQRVEKVLKGEHCQKEHNMQYEGCWDCEREKDDLIKDLAAQNEKLVSGVKKMIAPLIVRGRPYEELINRVNALEATLLELGINPTNGDAT